MTRQQNRDIERIKQKIVDGHRRGVCDREGNSVLNEHGQMVAQPKKRISRSAVKVFVYRNGKLVEKKP